MNQERAPKLIYLAIKISQELFDSALKQQVALPSNFISEKVPHITVTKPSMKLSPDSQAITTFVKSFENKKLVSNTFYAFYNSERNTTYFCLGFQFEELGLDKAFFRYRENVYTNNGITEGADRQLHMTLGASTGEHEIESFSPNPRYEIIFLPKKRLKSGDFLE